MGADLAQFGNGHVFVFFAIRVAEHVAPAAVDAFVDEVIVAVPRSMLENVSGIYADR